MDVIIASLAARFAGILLVAGVCVAVAGVGELGYSVEVIEAGRACHGGARGTRCDQR